MHVSMKEFLEFLRYTHRNFWDDSGWVMIEQDCRRPLAVVLMAWYTAKRIAKILICMRKGHSFEDAGSYATPDSGAENLMCTRCGYHFHHTYY